MRSAGRRELVVVDAGEAFRLGPELALGYAAGVLGVTLLGNVPLNEDLAAATDPVAGRAAFEADWNRLNLVRTIVSGAVFASVASGLL